MAIIYQADLSPNKMEALEKWLPEQSWANVDAGASLTPVSSYRFDDPEGEVGAEVHLVRVQGPEGQEGPVIQVPVSYRGTPADGLESALITEMDHSVLGRRWVYDGVADPVFAAELLRTIVESDTSATEYVQTDHGQEVRIDVAQARGTGAPDVHLDNSRRGAHDTGSQSAAHADQHATLPVVQETDGAALISSGGHTVALFRFPDTVLADPLDAEVRSLRVRIGDGTELLAARLVD